jgi:signal peptidase I
MRLENSVADAMLDIWKEVGGETSLQVSGYSMYPLIAPGENVIVKHTDADIRPGDIVAFKRGLRIVVHRVIRVCMVRGEFVLLCRGDNNLFLDARVTMSKILGKVLAIEKMNGASVNLGNGLWQRVGRLIVFTFNQSRKLRRRWFQKRVAKIFTRVALAVETMK